MPRRSARPRPDRAVELTTEVRDYPARGRRLWAANKPIRTVATLDGPVRLRLQVRTCRAPDCPRFKTCVRPEAEGRGADRRAGRRRPRLLRGGSVGAVRRWRRRGSNSTAGWRRWSRVAIRRPKKGDPER
jgi:hypothetical protein